MKVGGAQARYLRIHRLQALLLLAVLGTGGICALGFGLFSAQHQAEQAVSEQFRLSSVVAAKTLSASIRVAPDSVERTWEESLGAGAPQEHPLSSQHSKLPSNYDVVITTPQGRVLKTSDPRLLPLPREVKALIGPTVKFSGVIRQPGEPLYLAFSTPYVHHGRRADFIGALALTSITAQLTPFFEAVAAMPKGSSALMVDQHDRIMASSSSGFPVGKTLRLGGLRAGLARGDGSGDFEMRGSQMMFSASTATPAPWRVVFIEPRATSPVAASLLHWVPWMCLLLLGVALVGGIWLIRRLGQQSSALLTSAMHKNQFLAGITHELRTPLAVIDTYVSVLGDHGGDLSDEQRGDIYHKITDVNQHALMVLRELGHLARAESGRVRVSKEVVAIHALVQESCEALEPMAKRDDVKIVPSIASDVPEELVADPTLFRQLLYNYLTNAIKHSPPTGTITVRLRCHRGNLLLSVGDQGPGVPVEHQVTVFDAWRQLSDEDRARGEGLGLALCRSIAEAQGGSVWMHNAKQGGAVFHARIPTQVPDRGAKPRHPAQKIARCARRRLSLRVSRRRGDAPASEARVGPLAKLIERVRVRLSALRTGARTQVAAAPPPTAGQLRQTRQPGTDKCEVRVAEPGTAQRYQPLASMSSATSGENSSELN